MWERQTFSRVSLALAAMVLHVAGLSASAQTVVTGHYVPFASSGLKSGILTTRPGWIYQNSTIFFHATSFRDDNGDETGGVDEVNIWANRNTLLWVSGQKIFGADYAAAVAVPIANLAPNPVVVGGQTLETGVGFTDIPVVPVILGWHWTDFHVQGGYTVFLPVGKYTLGSSDNTGKGFWTHMFNVGGTWMPAGDRPWHVSLMSRYEIHSNQEGRDVRPGDTLTLEFGLGKKISDTVDVGLLAHMWRQVTDTTGDDAVNPLKYRVNGIGAEIQYLIADKFPAKARAGYDFGARNVAQGPWAVLEFNFPF